MPLVWRAPETFMTHNGVTIYHAYDGGDGNDMLQYHYNTDPGESDDTYEFDIRDLEEYDNDLSHQDILKAAIDNGHIAVPEDAQLPTNEDIEPYREVLENICNSFETSGCEGCGTVPIEAINQARVLLNWEPLEK